MPVAHPGRERRADYWFRLLTIAGFFLAASLAVAAPLGVMAQTPPATCQDPNAINSGGSGPCVYNLDYGAQRQESAAVRAVEQTGRTPPSGITLPTCGFTQFGCALVLILNLIVDFLIYITFPLGEHFLNSVIATSFTFTNAGDQFAVAANVGWAIVLGVVNSLFVLVLLWMAIATIFDFEPFTARSLLPKLIIAALLINFSLPIGRSIINLSNGIAGIFVTQINQRWNGVGNAVSLILDPQAITLAVQNKYTTMNREEAQQILRNSRTTYGILGAEVPVTAQRCYEYVNSRLSYLNWLGDAIGLSSKYQRCSAFLSDVRIARALVAIDPEYGKVTLLAGALVAKLTVVPIALFAVFAASVILLIRIISLTLLLIFGPFAFFGLILPYTRSYWSGWWEKLFRWSFFLPVFFFLFMLSLMVLQQIPERTKTLILNGEAVPDIGILFVNYLIGIGLMIASILVANQSSLYGAGAVVGVGKKLAGAADGWAKNRAWKFAGKLTEAAMKTPVLRQTIGRIAPLRAGAAAVMKKGAEVSKKDLDFYTKLSDSNLINMMRSMSPGLRRAVWGALPGRRQPKLLNMAREQGIALAPALRRGSIRQRLMSQLTGRPVPLPGGVPPGPSAPRVRETVRAIIQPAIDQFLGGRPLAQQGMVQRRVNDAISELRADATPRDVSEAIQGAVREAIRRVAPEEPRRQVEQEIRTHMQGIEPDIRRALEGLEPPAAQPRQPNTQELIERIEELESREPPTRT